MLRDFITFEIGLFFRPSLPLLNPNQSPVENLNIKKRLRFNSLLARLYAVYGYLVTLAGAGYFIFFGLLLSMVGLLVRPLLGQRLALSFGRFGMHYLLRFFFKGLQASGVFHFDLKELDTLRDRRGIIIAPNHPCLMDALFVSSRLPNVVSVMKPALLKNPILFGGAWLAGYIRSDSPISFIQQCRDSLDGGGQLLLFPEGTRSQNGRLNPFKGGIALVARAANAPVQTVFIDANTNFLGKNWPLLKKPDFPLTYKVTLGKQLRILKGQDHRVFTAELENYFNAHFDKGRRDEQDSKTARGCK